MFSFYQINSEARKLFAHYADDNTTDESERSNMKRNYFVVMAYDSVIEQQKDLKFFRRVIFIIL